jgi:ubiquinone/menaquinone biosynthesis C-methylase UbiE
MHPADAAKPAMRFSDRVADYVRYRPSYPAGVVETLHRAAGLGPTVEVADIGSGTGIFSALLLPFCARVHGVEPNDAMRAAAERRFAGDPRFVSVAASAEATTLPDNSVDLVVAAQAFHWFAAADCRREFARILRPGGSVALVWNERETSATPFLSEYEAFLHRRATDYAKVNHTNIDAHAIAAFFSPAAFSLAQFPNEQRLDFEALKGRLLSSSYAPNTGQPGHAEMIVDLAGLFSRHAQDGVVSFLYTTKLYFGRFN